MEADERTGDRVRLRRRYASRTPANHLLVLTPNHTTGTGGTIAGTGVFLKTMNEDVVVALSDPEGSGLYNKIKYGVMYDPKEAEGTKRRHQVDTVVEGMCVPSLDSCSMRDAEM